MLQNLETEKNKFSLLFVISLLVSSCITKTEVDLIIHNGTIYTVNDNNDVFESIVIQDGKIIDLGKNNQILNKYKSENTLDIEGKYAYPGFIDAHCHFLQYGLQQDMVDLSDAESYSDVIKLLKTKESNSNWLIGYGWDQNKWENSVWPDNKELNLHFKNKNIVIYRIDGHALLANQNAIINANINVDTVISGGHIQKIDGKISGLFIDNAMDLIIDKIPEPDENSKKNALLKAQRDCFSLGLTTVDVAGLNKNDIDLIDRLHSSEELKIKIYAMLSDSESNFEYYIDKIGQPIKKERLNIRSYKFFADGSLGSRGACLLKPYNDQKYNTGFMLQEKTNFEKKLTILKAHGFQACTHAIGDSANRSILNSYSKILKESNDLRWRIEHAQCVSNKDIVNFKNYNIIPSVQPTHATSDFNWAVKRLGRKRILDCYKYYSLFNQNKLIALGTDFPVEEINPIHTFYAAVFRKNYLDKPIGGFQKEESLNSSQAIRGMTIWAALANFEENEKGSLEIGKYADIVILSRDIITENEKNVLNTKVLKTIVNGEIVYRN